MLVLTRVNSLKDTEYGHIFIRRDLTYKQRQELNNRLHINSDSHGNAATGQAMSRPIPLLETGSLLRVPHLPLLLPSFP